MRANFKEGRIFDKIIKTLAPNNGALMKRAIFKINFAVTRPQGFSTFEILRNESRELFFFLNHFPTNGEFLFRSRLLLRSRSILIYLFGLIFLSINYSSLVYTRGIDTLTLHLILVRWNYSRRKIKHLKIVRYPNLSFSFV